jgi:hypothetical protein
MKLATLLSSFALLGCMGALAAASMASQGCTATVTAGSGDDDGQPPPGDDDDAGNNGDSGTVVQADSGSVPPNACNECLYEGCSGLYAICVNDLTCLGIFQCTVACAAGNDACLNACFNAQPSRSLALYDNLGICDYNGECNGGACATACNPSASYCTPAGDDDSGSDSGGTVVTDSGTGGDAAPAAQTCQQCQASTCASQLAATASGTAGFAYTQCVLGCTTADCTNICATNSPAGVQATQALGTCTSTNCAVCSQQ